MDAFYISAANGDRFCILHSPPAGATHKGCVLYVHPLAEEMNHSRRMASLQARALARSGYVVLQIDLLGCGDSSGDFADATWDAWLDDIDLGLQWLTQRYGGLTWLWGVRSGCLLAAQSAARSSGYALRLLLWQPVISGRQHLHQFLRLRQVSDVMHRGGKLGTEELLDQLKQGQMVEVAGYEMSPALANGLLSANMDDISNIQDVVCLEVFASAQTQSHMASPALEAQMLRWMSKGIPVRSIAVEGQAFWQLPEAQTSTFLIEATLAALAAG